MMDKKPHIKPYLYGMLAGFGAISLSIIFFFLIYRFDGFGNAISALTGILMPFIYGAVIAYLLKPVCNTIESFLRRFIPEKMHGLVNVLSITLTILFGLLLIYALCMMIIPQLITSVTTLYYTAQRNLAKFVQWANHVEFIENNQQIMNMLNSAYATISTNFDDLIKTRLLPSMQNIVSGKIMDSAIIGVLCYIGCLIFKFPSALLVSVIIGVTNVIPFFGPFIGAVPATLLILIQNPIKALWFVLFVLVLQQLDGNVIGPKILGNTTGLSSFWVLFAILLFGGLWGFVGMIVGVPLFAVIYDIIKKLVIHGLKRNAELDMLQTYHDNFGDPEDDASPAPEPSAEKQ